MNVATVHPHSDRPKDIERQSRAGDGPALVFIKFQIFAIVFLQKFGIHAGASDIQLVLLTLFLGLAVLAIVDRIQIDIVRTMLFVIFAFCAIVSQILVQRPFSAPSLILLLIMYPTLCLTRTVAAPTLLSSIRFYQSCMLVIAFLTIALQGVQYTIGAQYWPNLDRLLPEAILMRGYNYLQPLSYGSSIYKPNAIFMLEVSFIQQMTAIALLLEIAYFRRPLILLIFLIVILITFAGSGLLILAFALPAVLLTLPPRLSLLGLIVGCVVAAVALQLGWLGLVAGRFSEFTTVNTSGYFRFTLPVIIFLQNLANPDFLATGVGAGATPKGTAFLLLPFSKLMLEYGFLATLSFYVFLGTALFWRAPSLLAAYAVFLQYNLGGGYLAVPLNVVTFVALCTFLRTDRSAVRAAVAADRAGRTGWRALLA